MVEGRVVSLESGGAEAKRECERKRRTPWSVHSERRGEERRGEERREWREERVGGASS